MPLRALLLALSALLLAAATCGPPADDPPAPLPEPGGTIGSPSAAGVGEPLAPPELLEAVFRYQFEHNASGLQQDAAAYCLSLGRDRTVPETLLRRFAGHRPPVHAEPDCPEGEGTLTFGVRSVRWLSEDEAEVIGGYHEGNLSSSTESFRVVREGGVWRVVESRLLVIS